jgi:hypothetical protein
MKPRMRYVDNIMQTRHWTCNGIVGTTAFDAFVRWKIKEDHKKARKWNKAMRLMCDKHKYK